MKERIVEGTIVKEPLKDINTLDDKQESIDNSKESNINKEETTPTPLSTNVSEKVDTVLDIFPNIETNNLANTSNDTNDSSIGNNEGQPPLQSD